MTDALETLIAEFAKTYGRGELERLLKSKLSETRNVLTVVSDDTLHKIPEHIIQGELFVFSSGNFDTSSGASIAHHLEEKTVRLCKYLNSKNWARIRLVFSGHAILAATAKFVIYRITHIETEDVLYFGERGYVETAMKFRELLAAQPQSPQE